MPFPRLQPFNFSINSTYKVPLYADGRIDKAAYDVYNYTQAYKPLMRLNNISLGIGMRAGIRPIDEAIATELAIKNNTNDISDAEVNDVSLSLTTNSYDWISYGDVSNGYISDVNLDDVLITPSFDSVERWLRTYQFINQESETTTYTS